MSFEAFCEAFAMKLGKPATAEQLAKAEEKLGVSLAKSVRKLYESGDGGKARHDLSSLEIYSIKGALKYARVPRFFDAPWVLWPLIENNDSNPICVCCKAPLAGYVVLVSHDDAPRLMFRSLEGFFTAASDYIADGEYLDTYELPSDFAGPERTKGDLAAAKSLIALAKKLDDEDQTDALCFAADLLGDAEVAQIKGLFDFDNAAAAHYIEERLARIKGSKSRAAAPAAKSTAKPAKESFGDFVERCGELLRSAGVSATIVEMYGKKTIRLDPGSVWMNMQMFYEDRQRPDFNDYLLERGRAAVKGKRQK